MGLYDNYKMSNSTYIPQFVGSIVPELRDFSSIMKSRYEEARNTDDILVEAMGNMQHLSTEEDTQYANEMKQNYMNKLMERSEREDYENMGRRTKRDARQFASEYTPLVNRLKGMNAIKERVLQDKDIFSPETKQKILGKITYMNGTKRDPLTGDFTRDQNGKIVLNAIQDWAYAKDVDINKKLADFLSKKETDMTQSGYRSNGNGLMTSVKRETRSAAELARLAKEMMETDPEIKAMVERDVELTTYNYTPAQFGEIANKGNVSTYDKLKRQGLSDNQINGILKANGMSLETAKLKPVDVLRQDFVNRGGTVQQADQAFVKDLVRKGITAPHTDLVSQLLKVDKQTLEAREDPEFAAKALGAALAVAMAPKGSGDASPLLVTPDNSVQQLDVTGMFKAEREATEVVQEKQGYLRAAIGSYLNIPAPKGGKDGADWHNRTGLYLNDKTKQGELIQNLKNSGKLKEADNLTVAFRQYNELNNRAIFAKQKIDNIVGNREDVIKEAYAEYKKGYGLFGTSIGRGMRKGSLPYDKFKEALMTETPQHKFFTTGLIGGGWNPLEKDALDKAKNTYYEKLQAKAQQFGKSAKTSNTVFEPTSAGWLKNQTDFVEEGIKAGSVKGRDMATGESIDDILTNELGSGWFSKSISERDRKDPNSDFNKSLRNLRVRVNMGMRGANGEATATLTTPSGQVRTITLDNVSPNLPTEMAARMINSAGQYMTKGESSYMMQNAAKGAGLSQLKYLNEVDLNNIRPSAHPYRLNDMFYLKVQDAGVDGLGAKSNKYTLMTKEGNRFVPTSVRNVTSVDDVLQAIGGLEIKKQVSTTGRFSPF